MRYAIFFALALLMALAGEWTYRSFLRPMDLLLPEAIELAEHFNRGGVRVRPYPVRHGFHHSQVLAVAGYEITGYPLPIVVEFCPTEESAKQKLSSVTASQNLTHPNRNGRLVMSLPMWGDDTAPMATKVVNAFSSFKSGI